VFQADTKTVNPAVDQQVIDDAYAADPASASAEYGAQFRSDIEAFVSLDTITACISVGVHERGREARQTYTAFLDPAGGSGKTIHAGNRTQGQSDRPVRRRLHPRDQTPFSPDAVVEQYATLLKAYGIRKVTGDRYAGEWVREPFKKHGIAMNRQRAKSDLGTPCP
jgi:hypothetical protein